MSQHGRSMNAEPWRREASKSLSAVLRRDAPKLGLEVDGEGWVKLSDLLSSPTVRRTMGALDFFRHGFTEERLLDVIALSNAEKNRYELQASERGTLVRAIDKRKLSTAEEANAATTRGVDTTLSSAQARCHLTVLGLDGSTLCEVQIPQDSSVINARSEIAKKTGIPMQSLQLVLECKKLADPTAKLLSDPKQEAEVTCIRSALDPGDACAWCCDVLGVPVQSKCPCRSLYCITCIRDMIGLNGQPPKSSTCPTCHRRLSTSSRAEGSYTKRLDLVTALDGKYGALTCPRGCGTSYLRMSAPEHMNSCPCTKKRCPVCHAYYTGTREAHHRMCFGLFGDLDDLLDGTFR